MANIKANEKSILKQEKANKRNSAIKSKIKTHIKKAINTPVDNSKLKLENVSLAIKVLDKSVSQGVLHKKNVARRKSRLMNKINQQNISISKVNNN